jgi:hypothetical protein
VRSLGDAPFYPFVGTSALQTDIVELCLGWPTITPPPAPPTALPAVPTLVIDGAADLRTPIEDAAQIGALIPGAQILPIPHTGHSALAGDETPEQCALRGVAQFFTGVPVAQCAPTPTPFAATPVAPTRLARLPGTGGRGKTGRTVTAAIRTAVDMRRQVIGDLLEAGRLPRRLGGLRGGRATVSSRGTISLRRVVYVPGVEVSGTVPLDSTAPQRLRIGGRAGAHGSLVVTPQRITGRLDGRPIDLVAASASTSTSAATRAMRDEPYRRLLRRFRLLRAG